MTDREFLDYCEAHAETPRCGFTPAQVARLVRLAGRNVDVVAYWEAQSPGAVNMRRESIEEAVRDARARIV